MKAHRKSEGDEEEGKLDPHLHTTAVSVSRIKTHHGTASKTPPEDLQKRMFERLATLTA
ncbi:Hypothetical protein FKW44_021808 [Caligus rogercresseyi]|uniref:Uncharacterized protein n=1 Tax=Caligus rogercresseyi TaxID=217165 RepID=A0A7T8GRW4_CALRO|nr:Hypothetical protein FKW44_021808 [Caligus rogercresseyi]